MKPFLKGILFFVLFAGLGLVLVWTNRNELIRPVLEKWTNQTQSAFFKNTLKIEGFNLKNDLRMSIAAVRGIWQTEQGGFPFEINDVAVTDPVTYFILRRPVHVTFKRFRPRASSYPGLEGKIILFNDKAGTFELDTVLTGLYLEELTALNPEVLKGSSGKLTGRFYLKTKKAGEQKLHLLLEAAPPGGRLQAHFFDMLLPYLPEAEKETLARIHEAQTVGYEKANVTAELSGKDSLKFLLNIKVPEYNLNLNLNLTIRVEDNEVFFPLAQLMGLVKAEDA